jgi:hypothetical protein
MKVTLALLSLAVASISATAQTNKQTWQDLIKPYEAKTNPAVPLAPPQPVAPRPTGNTALLDGCVIDAIGRLPKADGLRVTNSSYEYSAGDNEVQIWTVSVSVDLHGRQAHYSWHCGIYKNTSATLRNIP